MEHDEILIERKEKITTYIKSEEYKPLKRKELAIIFSVPKEERELFDAMIEELLKEGTIMETKKGKLMSPESLNMYAGTFISHAKGFGFVSVEGLEKDIFVPGDSVGQAMHRDKVLVRIAREAGNGKRAEGAIVRVLERGMKEIIGTFEMGKGFGFVRPDDKKMAQDIFISRDNTIGAVTGHKVVVEIIRYTEERRNPEGKIVEILGHIDDPGVDIMSIIRQHNLPMEFPKEVIEQIENLQPDVTEKDKEDRKNLRDTLMITIDGADAKDLDDAVSLEILPNGHYYLGVHIADVSHYVTEHSPMDKEAFNRGTSVYLVDRVIPMIPHKLSNGICSLNPEVDRLALSCLMEINAKGEVVAHEVIKSVICSNYRMTYTGVREILEDKTPELLEKYKEIIDMLTKMNDLRQILGRRRKKRGSINFDLPESKIILDETGKPIEILPSERSIATNMIEEFMLICNETVAEDYFWQEIPFLYRNHEVPDDEKIQKMEDFIRTFGYRLKGMGEVRPTEIQKVLEQVEGKDEERVITRVVLRSMKQARYMAENIGHFGLAAKYYCHFTSPIRRYPDLEIHRLIKMVLEGKMTDKKCASLQKIMPDIAKQCSVRERIAEEAERDTDDLKKVEFMMDKIGECFTGIISGVTNWGIFVELPNTVEGMVSLAMMEDDYYIFNDERLEVYGEHSGKKYRLGDHVSVQVAKADKETRTIDFVFVEEKEE